MFSNANLVPFVQLLCNTQSSKEAQLQAVSQMAAARFVLLTFIVEVLQIPHPRCSPDCFSPRTLEQQAGETKKTHHSLNNQLTSSGQHTGLRRSYGCTSSRGRCSAAAFLNPDVRVPCLSVSSYRHLIVDSKVFSRHTHRIKVSASYVALVDT